VALSTRPRYYSRYEQMLPYPTPDSLDELQGPVSGVITVDYNINTSPTPSYDLSDDSRIKSLYAAALRDGTVKQQREIINKDKFLELWPELNLPGRCLDVWESKFPQLISIYESARNF